MARYTGPTTKIARKFGEPIFGPDKSYEKKNYPPGQHGIAKKRKKTSEYGIQLKEKQKVKYTYGLFERQFRNLYERASRMKGRKGENLVLLLESRLDNLVYGELCNIPSSIVKAGDVIAVRERSKSLEIIQESISRGSARFSWIEWDGASLTGKYLNMPIRSEVPETINEQLIVELYSK